MEKVIINANNMAEYNKLKAQGAKVLWVGEGKICFEVKTLKVAVGAGLGGV